MYFIYRNNQKFGPYPAHGLLQYVNDGSILLNDEASEQFNTTLQTVKFFLKANNLKPKIKSDGTIIHQILKVGTKLIIPDIRFFKKDFITDKRLLYLALIGLLPAILIKFTFSNYFTFYTIALYFSLIWAVFFFYLFKTPQVEIKKAVIIYFLTQAFALLLIQIQVLPPISFFYSLIYSDNFIYRLIGYIIGVGVLEETIKALPVFFILKRSKKPLYPQTLVYYGMLSGLGFGILEAVQYQTSTNTTLDYSNAFFMNIARLTSLPFLHAVWGGISAYFLSFSFLFPKYRKAMFILAIIVPAVLHGLYDVFGWSIIGLFICFFSVFALKFYLKNSQDYQNKLIKI